MEEGDETKVREKITVLQVDTDRLGLMPSHSSWFEKLVPGLMQRFGHPWENWPCIGRMHHWTGVRNACTAIRLELAVLLDALLLGSVSTTLTQPRKLVQAACLTRTHQ